MYKIYRSHQWADTMAVVYKKGEYLTEGKDLDFEEVLYRLNIPFETRYIKGVEFYRFPELDIDMQRYVTEEDEDYNYDDEDDFDYKIYYIFAPSYHIGEIYAKYNSIENYKIVFDLYSLIGVHKTANVIVIKNRTLMNIYQKLIDLRFSNVELVEI